MFKIILTMAVGICLGIVLRKVRFISYISKTISITIYMMLFLLGITIGNSPVILDNLSTLGLQAFILAFAGILGSLLAGWALSKWVFREEESFADAGFSPQGDSPERKKWKQRLKKISDSGIVIVFFIIGIFFGLSDTIKTDAIGNNTVMIALYCLIFQVGINLGYDTTLKNAIKGMKPKVLLVPLATVVGTLSLSAVAGLFLSKWSVADCLAASSGFAYYSLSSVLIAEYASASLGEYLAAELGTIALLVNIIRELSCLLFTPFYTRIFGKIAPICVAGVTSVDVCLPVILKSCGKEYMPIAIINGVIVDFSVPFFVSFFCSL